MFKTKLSLLLLITTIFTFSIFAQDEAEKAGREIYDKYQTAIGGKENLDKIKYTETVSEIELMGSKKKQTTIVEKATKKSYSVTEGGIEGKQESGFDGTRTWIKNMSFRGYRDGGMRATFNPKNARKLPNETIEGKEYFVLENTDNNVNVKTYYDTKTYLLERTETKGEVNGNPISQTTITGDYRKVGDVLVAFSQKTILSGGITASQKVLSVRHNIEIDPKIFEFSADDKKEDKSFDTATKQPTTFRADSNSVFKDENGKVISQGEFLQKQSSGNYQFQPITTDGKMVGMQLKKGASETEIGATPPDFNTTFLDNSPANLSQLKGKVVVLNFWFTACAPCIKEVPELNDLVKKYEGKDVEFLSITYDPKDVATEFVKKHNFKYKHIVDAQNIIDSFKVTAYPTHIVIDRDGKIKFTQFGYQTGIMQSLVKNIDDGLAKSANVEWDKRNPNVIVPENIKKETLEKVWKTINDSHFDPTFNGVDWNAVKAKYEPQLSGVKTNQDLTDLMNKMVGELKQSHLKVHPANAVAINGVMPANVPKTGNIGLELRLLENFEVVVSKVAKDSMAEKAGFKKGYIIKKVDGETIASIAQKQKEKGGFQLRDELLIPRAVTGKLAGDLSKKVSVTFLDETDAEKTIEVDRQNPGMRSLTFESKELNANVGYIRFNIFLDDLPKKFEEAISTMQSKKAVIVDLRGNPGGVGNHTTAIAAMLDKEKRSLGVTKFRYNKTQFEYEGNDKSFTGKVFILVDEMSGSSAEVLAGGLQSNKRAIVIGSNSAGAVLPSTTELLPNGGALQYAIGDFATPDGKVLEGKGVTPDVEVKLTRKDLLAGKDTALETALRLVNN
jgi:carboxyl-terminal processing protease